MTTYAFPTDFAGPRFQKLTVPYDGPDSNRTADEIVPPRLDTFTHKPYCWLYGQALVHGVYHGGATTSGSKNPRSEWRETNLDGSLAKWDGSEGYHKMVLPHFQLNQLTPVKPHAVLAQIHDGSDDVSVLRAEGVKDWRGQLTPDIDMWLTKGDSKYLKLGRVQYKDRMAFGFYALNGKLHIVFNGRAYHPSRTLNIDIPDDCYYKWGMYLQSNWDTAPNESRWSQGQAVFYTPPLVAHAA
jgi:hypothetical protein